MREDTDKEDYDDDPIRLFDCEQSRVCYAELTDIVIEDPGFIINTTKDEEERFEEILSACRNKTSVLPKTFIENNRNVECCPLSINVINCDKFLAYCEKQKDGKISHDITDVSQNLTENNTNVLPKRTIENTTEVVSKQVLDQINLKLKRREATSIANVNNRQSVIINNGKGLKTKNTSVDANVLNNNVIKFLTNADSSPKRDNYIKVIGTDCPKLGTPIKPLHYELNVNRNHIHIKNNIKQISNKRICAVEKDVNDILDKQLANIRSVKMNKPGTKVIEKCQYKNISRGADLAATTVSVNSPKKKPTNVNKKYDEQTTKSIISNFKRNELLKTSVKSNHVQNTMQSEQNKPCTKVMCNQRLFSANKEIPHYHNISVNNTVINRQQEHNSNRPDCAACTGNIYNCTSFNTDPRSVGVSNRNMSYNYINNNNNIPTNLTPNSLPCYSNYVASQYPKDNITPPNRRITIDGYGNPPGLKRASEGINVNQTSKDKIPPMLNHNQLINANNPQNFPTGSVLSNSFPQHYFQPLPYQVNAQIPANLNIYNGNLQPPINNNIVNGAARLPLVIQDQPVAYSNINYLTVKPNLPPQTQVISQGQSSFLRNNEGMVNPRSTVVQQNVKRNINNLTYILGTSTSKDRSEYESTNIVFANKHPHLVKILEGQPIEKKLINSNVISTENKVNPIQLIRSNPAIPSTVTTKNIKQNQFDKYKKLDKRNITNPGYSPPILPILTYEKVFEILSSIKNYYFEGDKMYVNTEMINDDIDYDTLLQSLPKKPILKTTNKRKIEEENEKVPRKITICEYKERCQRVDVKKVRN